MKKSNLNKLRHVKKHVRIEERIDGIRFMKPILMAVKMYVIVT